MLNSVYMVFDGVELKPYSTEHYQKTVEWLADPHIAKSFGITYPVDIISHTHWISQQHNLMMWAIYFQNNYIGNVSLRITSRHKKAYFEIYIGDEAARGAGVGKNVLSLIMNHAFDSLMLNRLYLYTHASNVAANKLYVSAGFMQEGVERQSVLTPEGIYIDQILWGILKSDWELLHV